MREEHRRRSRNRSGRRGESRPAKRSRSRSCGRSRSHSRSRGRSRSRSRSCGRDRGRRSSRSSRSRSPRRRQHLRFGSASPPPQSTRSSSRSSRGDSRWSRSPTHPRHYRIRSPSRSRSRKHDEAMASIGDHARDESAPDSALDTQPTEIAPEGDWGQQPVVPTHSQAGNWGPRPQMNMHAGSWGPQPPVNTPPGNWGPRPPVNMHPGHWGSQPPVNMPPGNWGPRPPMNMYAGSWGPRPPMNMYADNWPPRPPMDIHADNWGPQPAEKTRGRSHGRRGGKGPKISIPDNWTDVASMGSVVGASRFVPIRVPLDAKYAHLFERQQYLGQQWTPRLFVEEQAARGLDVRLVIDLTNTFKYYDGVAEFQGTGIEYAKLKIEGFHGPPEARDVARFVEIVDAFLAKEPAGRIAVHCTHGLNRTGYLVVTYMVQRLGCSVSEALAAFSDARPPGLIKHMYVEDLYRRFGRDGEEVQLPTLPDWASSKYAARERRH